MRLQAAKKAEEEERRRQIERLKELEVGVKLEKEVVEKEERKAKVDRKSTRLNSSHSGESRMPSSA